MLPFPFFHYLLFGTKSLGTAWWWGWSAKFPLLRKGSVFINYLGFFCEKDLLFCFFSSPLFSYLKFTYKFITFFSFLFCALSYTTVWCYLFSCTNFSTFGSWECFHMAPLSLWHTPSFCLLSTSLISGTIRCSRIILYIHCPVPGVGHFSKDLWFLY